MKFRQYILAVLAALLAFVPGCPRPAPAPVPAVVSDQGVK